MEAATTAADSLLTADGIRHIYTRLVPNFLGFAAVGLLIVAMIGVRVCTGGARVGRALTPARRRL